MERLCDDLGKLLDHRFGDGSIYLRRRTERKLYREAKRRGLVDEYGHLTKAGYRYWGLWYMEGLRGASADLDCTSVGHEKREAA